MFSTSLSFVKEIVLLRNKMSHKYKVMRHHEFRAYSFLTIKYFSLMRILDIKALSSCLCHDKKFYLITKLFKSIKTTRNYSFTHSIIPSIQF